ncbi:MAG TPA: hypothetical protein DDZ51_16860 [Planctomycetaceae bacterium]|nr:hypothetical protein [Planctomycetaceae bacterium]
MKKKPNGKPTSQQRSIQHIPASELAEWPVHPLADKFPIVPDQNLERLADSLAIQQEHPVIACRGMIIDGRNRIAAGRRRKLTLSVEVRDDLDEAEIEQLIIALNVERRSIPKAKLVEVAAEYYDSQDPSEKRKSLEEVAKMFGVARRTLCRYREKQRNPNQQKPFRISFDKIPKQLRIMPIALSGFPLLKTPNRRPIVYRQYQTEIIDLATEMLSEPELQHLWDYWFGDKTLPGRLDLDESELEDDDLDSIADGDG